MRQRWFPLLASFALLAVGSIRAQLGKMPIKANVPFAFRVGDLEMPPGQYTVRQMDDSGSLVVLGSGSAIKIVASSVVEAATSSQQTKLVFHSYAGTYFLAQVWLRGAVGGRQLSPTRLERERANERRPQFVAIVGSN